MGNFVRGRGMKQRSGRIFTVLDGARATGRRARRLQVNAVRQAEQLQGHTLARPVYIVDSDGDLGPVRFSAAHRCYRNASIFAGAEYQAVMSCSDRVRARALCSGPLAI